MGGGASRLADALIADGYRDLTVVDISTVALDRAKARLADAADKVRWIAADVTAWRPQRSSQMWHDRAAFHFLTSAEDQEAYLGALRAGTSVGSTLVIATLALDGPER